MKVNTCLVFLFFITILTSWENPKHCGTRNQPGRRNLITNGDLAEPYDFPWQVGVVRRTSSSAYVHFCGGSILNEKWILSAAHCFHGGAVPEKIAVIVGDYHYLQDDTDVRQLVFVEKVIAHKKFQMDGNLKHDVALLRLNRTLNLSQKSPWKVTPVCLPNPNESAPYGEEVLISGWGALDDGLPAEHEMRWSTGFLRNDDYCLALGGELFYNPSDQICFDKYFEPKHPSAMYYDTSEGDCRGDSGGAMVHQQDDGRFYQEGINSHGVFCGNLLSVAVHTEVRAYIEWITSHIQAYDNATFTEPFPTNNTNLDPRCKSEVHVLLGCLQNYLALNCPATEEEMPKCAKDWMSSCILEISPSACMKTKVSECSKQVLVEMESALTGPPFCHPSCETCGYLNRTVPGLLSERDCVTCPPGFQIEVVHGDCRGKCVKVGKAKDSHSCNSPTKELSCILDPNIDPSEPEPEWSGSICLEDHLENNFTYVYCHPDVRNCAYPLNDNYCGQGFSMCKNSTGDYRCFPTDGIGSPRMCEQCMLDEAVYLFGECHLDRQLVETYYPNTTLSAYSKSECRNHCE